MKSEPVAHLADRAVFMEVSHEERATHNDPVCGKKLACGGTCCLVEGHAGKKCLCIGDDEDEPGTCTG
jgi:hypothetical protein